MKRIANREIIQMVGGGGPFMIQERGESIAYPARAADLARAVLTNLPVETMGDAEHGVRLVTSSRAADGFWEMDDADYKWLVSQVETWGPKSVGLMAVQLRDALQIMEPEEVAPEEIVEEQAS